MTKDELYELVKKIPKGKVISYGAIGKLGNGFLPAKSVGWFMGFAVGMEIPWWRVVGKDGGLPIAKRDPNLAQEQKARLESEGVKFLDTGLIDMNRSEVHDLN